MTYSPPRLLEALLRKSRPTFAKSSSWRGSFRKSLRAALARDTKPAIFLEMKIESAGLLWPETASSCGQQRLTGNDLEISLNVLEISLNGLEISLKRFEISLNRFQLRVYAITRGHAYWMHTMTVALKRLWTQAVGVY